MPAVEHENKRFFPASIFGHAHAQPCMVAPCENIMIINELMPGDIWMCAKCMAKHEFYEQYASGPGGRLRYGVCRILVGAHRRDPGEPSILEFVE